MNSSRRPNSLVLRASGSPRRRASRRAGSRLSTPTVGVAGRAWREARLRGEPLALSTKEFGLLELFMRNPGRVLSRDHILDHAWDDEFDSFSNIVDVYV